VGLIQQGKIRLLIDASNFSGWGNIATFERHIGFVKNSPPESGAHIHYHRA
jgi:hypothetical protein